MLKTPSTLLAHKAGYIDRDNEVIVGSADRPAVQAGDLPVRRAPDGRGRLKAAGFEADPQVHEAFTKYRKSHNDGVFDAYTPEIMNAEGPGSSPVFPMPTAAAASSAITAALRFTASIADLEAKRAERAQIDDMWPTDEVIRIARGAVRADARAQGPGLDGEALRLRHHEARRECAGSGAVDLFRLSRRNQGSQRRGDVDRPHLEFPRHLHRARPEGRALDEAGRRSSGTNWCRSSGSSASCARRTMTRCSAAIPTGRPNASAAWIWMAAPLVTKSSYRMLHTLTNLGPAPEPNITVLWSNHMPAAFKRYCVKVSKDTSSLQYENDDLMRPFWGDDYGIACCVSAMRSASRCSSSAPASISQRRCSTPSTAAATKYPAIRSRRRRRRHRRLPRLRRRVAKFDTTMEWLARTYVHAMNCIHYMHDKYFYERLEMALHDRDILRTMAFGIAGLSVVADSLARSSTERSASSATRPDWCRRLSQNEGATRRRRNSATTTTGSTASRRTRHAASWRRSASIRPIATRRTPRACSPSRRTWCTARLPAIRRTAAARASRSGRAPTRCTAATAMAGSPPACRSQSFPTRIRRTASATPSRSRRRRRICPKELIDEAVKAFDVYFERGGFHMNLNVIDKETLEDAMKNPDKYPQLTIRVSGYAVNFVRLTPEQQRDVISRTFHGQI
jgi:formate C-acetyltransferase